MQEITKYRTIFGNVTFLVPEARDNTTAIYVNIVTSGWKVQELVAQWTYVSLSSSCLVHRHADVPRLERRTFVTWLHILDSQASA